MKKQLLAVSAILTIAAGFDQQARAQAQMTAPAPTEAEKEALYVVVSENRTVDTLKRVNLADSAKSNALHDVIVAQYHDLRVRDAEIDTRLRVDGKEINYANRAAQLALKSKPLHDQFVTKLSGILTPDQVEQVKDLMT